MLKITEDDSGGGGGGGGGEESASMASPVKGRLKFFCSHGGKIMPRPSDGTLKYVGGETRIVVVPRSITYSELMQKINDLFEGEYIFKYQISSEDLDSLVSVKSDEDIRHLLDEYDRLEKEGLKLRTFLFPVKPAVMESQASLSVLGPNALEQRFIDAINGTTRNMSNSKPPLNTRLKSFSPSPTDGSSPQSLSPRSNAYNSVMTQDNSLINSLQSRLSRLHKVQSSPSLCTLGNSQYSPGTSFTNSFINQQPHIHHYPNQQYQYNHLGYQSPNIPLDHHSQIQHGYQSPSPRQDYSNHSHHGYQSPTNTHDHHMPPSPHTLLGGGEHGKVSFARGPVGYHNPAGYYYPLLKPYPGSGGHGRWGHLEQFANVAYENNQLMRADSRGNT